MSNNVKIINIPKIEDPRGNLTFIEQNKHIPFEIKRVYWIYDVPGGEIRGSHAYKTLNEFVVALSGSFDVVLHDGKEEITTLINFLNKIAEKRKVIFPIHPRTKNNINKHSILTAEDLSKVVMQPVPLNPKDIQT